MLENFNNYGPYAELIKTGKMTIYTKDFTKDNIDQHFFWILNIFRDGIELEEVQKAFVKVIFDDGIDIDLSLQDLLCNVIMWDLIIKADIHLEPKHLFFEKAITQNSIKKYIDNFFLEEKRKLIPNIKLNNMIDDMMFKWCYIDEFNGYLANTINLEDFVKLMRSNPEFDKLLHADLSQVPLEEVKAVGMKYVNNMIDIIKNSDHCLADFFRAGEGVNPKQFKEVAINIGTKPDGRGGVYPTVINTNFLTGGVNDIVSFFIEESGGRVAQIIVEGNVGISGYFARLLGLNNYDTIIHPDPNYVCDSQNFQEVFIKDEKILERFENRYYRLNPKGQEYLLKNNKELIGQTIYLRSPMTCASHARGHGICYRCYGDLAYTNNDINIGKIAAEEISSKLTQRMLSAKHLLESSIKKIKWSPDFQRFCELDCDIIKITSDDSLNLDEYRLLIGEIVLISEYDDNDEDHRRFNEYVTEFQILSPTGEVYDIHTMDCDNLFITPELNTIIREKAVEYDGKLSIKLKHLYDCPLFIIEIQNSDLSVTLDKIKSIIDKSAVVKELDRHQILQILIETFIEGGLNVSAVHGEVILSNQLRSVDNILETPQWQYPNEPYRLLTLSQSLTNNPSVIVSLSYEGLSKMLYNPLTYRKNKPSFLDLFFMKNPSKYLSNKEEIKKAIDDNYIEKDKKTVVKFIEDEEDESVD
jgi:hypothetical protein